MTSSPVDLYSWALTPLLRDIENMPLKAVAKYREWLENVHERVTLANMIMRPNKLDGLYEIVFISTILRSIVDPFVKVLVLEQMNKETTLENLLAYLDSPLQKEVEGKSSLGKEEWDVPVYGTA